MLGKSYCYKYPCHQLGAAINRPRRSIKCRLNLIPYNHLALDFLLFFCMAILPQGALASDANKFPLVGYCYDRNPARVYPNVPQQTSICFDSKAKATIVEVLGEGHVSIASWRKIGRTVYFDIKKETGFSCNFKNSSAANSVELICTSRSLDYNGNWTMRSFN